MQLNEVSDILRRFPEEHSYFQLVLSHEYKQIADQSAEVIVASVTPVVSPADNPSAAESFTALTDKKDNYVVMHNPRKMTPEDYKASLLTEFKRLNNILTKQDAKTWIQPAMLGDVEVTWFFNKAVELFPETVRVIVAMPKALVQPKQPVKGKRHIKRWDNWATIIILLKRTKPQFGSFHKPSEWDHVA